ncbi:MAG: hypothetical protein IJT16_08260 [Lachnospiraceae bacterium]|nr:hypothetical protein [Lachnospiraceae bacterium]
MKRIFKNTNRFLAAFLAAAMVLTIPVAASPVQVYAAEMSDITEATVGEEQGSDTGIEMQTEPETKTEPGILEEQGLDAETATEAETEIDTDAETETGADASEESGSDTGGETLIEAGADTESGRQTQEDEAAVIEEDAEEPDPNGYVYVEETEYHFTFLIINGGEIKKIEQPNNLSSAGNMYSAVDPLAINQIMALAGDNDILYWQLGVNGHSAARLTDDFKDVDTSAYYPFQPRMDYTLTAVMKRSSANNIFVEAVPSVYYDGRAHVSEAEELSEKALNKNIGDLKLRVVYLPDGAAYEDAVDLRCGRDYKLAYRNNVNASMKMTDEGTYQKLELPDKKRPCVQVTGLNDYLGFAAEVYFDILPYNFGEYSQYNYDGKYNAQLQGVDTSYTLKNGKLPKAITPKVTLKNYYTGKTSTLKKDTDYEVRLYRYDESSKWIQREDVTETGRWLCIVRGKGNYCGTLFGQSEFQKNAVFNDGTQAGALNPAVCNYTGAEVPAGQFRVEEGQKDLSRAKVTVRYKNVPYLHGRYYTGTELGITVKLGNYELEEGNDYKIVYDGEDYLRLTGKNLSNKVFSTTVDSALFDDEIWMANKYKIRIEAIAGNPNGYYGSQDSASTVTIKGVTIKPSWFKLSTASKKYDGTYGSGGDFTYDPRMETVIMTDTVDSYLSGYYSDSSGYRTYNYLDGVKNVFDTSYYSTGYYDYGVLVFSDHAKLPGTYKRTVVPFGPGVDHSYEADVNFKIQPLAMKDAVKSGIIKASVSGSSDYNAGGALPGTVKISFNGRDNNLTMHYNNEIFTIYDQDWDSMQVKLSATQNNALGTAYLTVTAADSRTLTGSAAKVTRYSIYKKAVSAPTIRVLTDSDYEVVYGRKTGTVPVTMSEPVGTLYAVMQPVIADKNGKFPAKSKIDLYQSYYADKEGYEGKRAALKKLAASQYTLTGTEVVPQSFEVTVTNGKTGAEKTGLDFTTVTTLSQYYDVYGENAAITSVTVMYGGNSYTLPADSKKLMTYYTGDQVKFDSVTEVRIKSKTDGEVSIPVSDCTIVYGDNVMSGNNKGTMTVTLKKGTGVFKYGATKTFSFNIFAKEKVIM